MGSGEKAIWRDKEGGGRVGGGGGGMEEGGSGWVEGVISERVFVQPLRALTFKVTKIWPRIIYCLIKS